MKVFYVDGARVICEKSIARSFPLAEAEFVREISRPDEFRSREPPVLLGEDMVFFQNTTAEAAVEIVRAHLAPPIILRHHAQMNVNRAIRHEIIEVSDVKQADAVRRAWKLASWLYEYSTLPGDWNGETLENTVPKECLEFELPSSGWDLLARELKRHKPKLNPRDNMIYSMQSVLGEQLGFANSSLRSKLVHREYLSLLRYRLHPAEPVLMGITAEIDFETPQQCNQVYIAAYPTLWMYKIMTNCCPEIKNTAMLMHSITAYAMHQLHPNLTKISIHHPTDHMLGKLKESASKHGFGIDESSGNAISIALRPAFTLLWRSIWGEPALAIESKLCDACHAQAVGTCAKALVCSEACAALIFSK